MDTPNQGRVKRALDVLDALGHSLSLLLESPASRLGGLARVRAMPPWVESVLKYGGLAATIAVVALLVNRRMAVTLAARGRKADHLREQIKLLYGPVTYLLESAERSHGTHVIHNEAYQEHFKTRHSEHDSEDMSSAIALMNHYGDQMVKANRAARDIFKQHWGLLDKEDLDDVDAFLDNVERQEIEEGWRMPLDYFHNPNTKLKPKVIHTTMFVVYFRKRLQEKQAELSALSKH